MQVRAFDPGHAAMARSHASGSPLNGHGSSRAQNAHSPSAADPRFGDLGCCMVPAGCTGCFGLWAGLLAVLLLVSKRSRGAIKKMVSGLFRGGGGPAKNAIAGAQPAPKAAAQATNNVAAYGHQMNGVRQGLSQPPAAANIVPNIQR